MKKELTSEKQISKGSIERITQLTEQITNLEKQLKKMPGEFPESEWPPLGSSKKDKK